MREQRREKTVLSKLKTIILLLCFVAIGGCGFHLRHHTAEIGNKYPTIILAPSGSNTLNQGIYRALISSSVHVVENSALYTDAPQLWITSQGITSQPLVYGSDSELRRERLKMSVKFSFGTPNSLQQFELTTERDRQLNPNQHLGDNAEKIVIEREMQADIISQLMRYLATTRY